MQKIYDKTTFMALNCIALNCRSDTRFRSVFNIHTVMFLLLIIIFKSKKKFHQLRLNLK